MHLLPQASGNVLSDLTPAEVVSLLLQPILVCQRFSRIVVLYTADYHYLTGSRTEAETDFSNSGNFVARLRIDFLLAVVFYFSR